MEKSTVLFAIFLAFSPLAHAGGELSIVSLMPSYTEIIFALGSGARLAGVTNFCNYPAGTAGIEKIGDYLHPDIEKIVSLKPGIILAGNWQSPSIVPRLKNLGLRVVVIPEEKRVADIIRTVRITGSAINRKKEAEKLASRLYSELKAVSVHGHMKRPAVYIEIDKAYWTTGGGSFISDVISLAGGENIFAGKKKTYFRTSWETVADRDPDAIISLSADSREIAGRPAADKMKAVKNSAIITGLDRDMLSRPSPRIVEVIRILRQELTKLRR
ncbi:MAG: helical backbone metal receptor [bacterium]